MRKLLLTAALVTLPHAAFAHGIWGHIHVTGWALENLPPGDARDFFSDPEVFNAAIFGAAFTDSGYFPQSGDLSVRSRAYTEHTHWEPFVESYVAWMRENDPPPWDDIESRKRAAFLIGAACHGLQDEIFDSVFLLHAAEEEGSDQSQIDSGTDGFLALDAHLRFVPEPYVPYDVLLELYDEDVHEDIDRDTIESAVELMQFLYVREGGWLVAEGLGNQYSEEIPWTRAHYMDPAIPSSLRAEINPTAAYVEAVFERLHGTFDTDEVVVAAYPDLPRRLMSGESDSVQSMVTMIFGAGVSRDTITSGFETDGGDDVSHRLDGTRWGSSYPRLIRLQPQEDLDPGAWYRASLGAGMTLVSGDETAAEQTLRFQVACDDDGDDACEPIDVEPASITGPPLFEDDAGPDAGDAGTPDAGDDVGGADADDVGQDTPDAGSDTATDTDEPDADEDTRATEPDSDAGLRDGDGEDAGLVTVSGGSRGGCAHAQPPRGGHKAAWALLFVALLSGRRRRQPDARP